MEAAPAVPVLSEVLLSPIVHGRQPLAVIRAIWGSEPRRCRGASGVTVD